MEKQTVQETFSVVNKNNTKQPPDNYSGETYAVVNKKDKNETALNDVYAEVNKETKPDVYAEVNKSKQYMTYTQFIKHSSVNKTYV